MREAFWPWERRLHISDDNLTYTLCGKSYRWWGTWQAVGRSVYGEDEEPTCGKCIKKRDSIK